MVVIDATMAMLLLQPNAAVVPGPDGAPIDRPADRVHYLVTRLDTQSERLLLPTPALAEVLVRVGARAAERAVEFIDRHWAIRIEPFDTRAAIEVAAMARDARDRLEPRDDRTTWAKLKYDRQIVAIAKVNRATAVYSDDKGLRAVAGRAGIEVIGLPDLPLPPERPGQHEFAPERGGQFNLLD